MQKSAKVRMRNAECRIKNLHSSFCILHFDFRIFFFGWFFFDVLMDATKIAINSSLSFCKSDSRLAGTISASTSNSSQYADSSNSCKDPSILLTKSAGDLARHASPYFPPTEDPLRRTWLPITFASPLFGNFWYMRII